MPAFIALKLAKHGNEVIDRKRHRHGERPLQRIAQEACRENVRPICALDNRAKPAASVEPVQAQEWRHRARLGSRARCSIGERQVGCLIAAHASRFGQRCSASLAAAGICGVGRPAHGARSRRRRGAYLALALSAVYACLAHELSPLHRSSVHICPIRKSRPGKTPRPKQDVYTNRSSPTARTALAWTWWPSLAQVRLARQTSARGPGSASRRWAAPRPQRGARRTCRTGR